jgi:hypothetical protein
MPKKSPRKGKIILRTFTKETVLPEVSTFFIIIILLIYNRMNEIANLKNHLEKVACFNPGSEHLEFHRNKEKTSALCYKNTKQLKEGGSFFPVWW